MGHFRCHSVSGLCPLPRRLCRLPERWHWFFPPCSVLVSPGGGSGSKQEGAGGQVGSLLGWPLLTRCSLLGLSAAQGAQAQWGETFKTPEVPSAGPGISALSRWLEDEGWHGRSAEGQTRL